MLKIRYALVASALCLAPIFCSSAFAQQTAGRDASTDGDIQRAQVLYDSGRTEQALEVVEGVLSRAAGDPEARFLQGLIYAEMDRRDDAIAVFSALTEDYEELPEPWNNLAVLFAENGEFDKARQALLAAIQTHPSYSTAHENLGDLYARMASMAYDRALEQDQGNQSARLKLSAVNGLFSVPAATPAQVAAVAPTQVPAPAPRREPEPEPVEPQPVEPPPATVAAVTPEPAIEPAPEPEPEPEPVAAVPEPTPQPAARPPANPDEVALAVRTWASAWSDQDVEGYLASYAPSFRPANGASRASWNRYRRDRLTKPSFISVEISDLAVDIKDSETAVATFSQRYRSDNYEDQVRKTLNMVRAEGRWQIAAEASQ